MTFEERITPLLVALTHEILDRGLYSYVEDTANFLKALSSCRWQQLPVEEQLFWIKRLSERLGGQDSLVDVLGYKHPVLEQCTDVLYQQERALSRAT